MNLTTVQLDRYFAWQTGLASFLNLRGADLRRADFHGANLRGANLTKTTLCGANIDGVILERYDIGGPGHILCALTTDEWVQIQKGRENEEV